mgnify:CR=1 FL=1
MRYFIKFSYNGTNYHGWQYQPNARSVQETLSKALSVIINSSADKQLNEIALMGAGRTDTGVHAKEMYAHFDFDKLLDTKNVVHKLNSFLPKDIAVQDVILVHGDAHVRFDAVKRTYQYHIHTLKNVFLENLSWYYPKDLDIHLMNQATNIVLKHTDFQCFSKVNTDVNTFNCHVYEAYWVKEKNNLIFTISADRFLRNMVRSIVGTLIKVGLHKITLEDFNTIIINKNRSEAGFSVPAHGLYLTKIEYYYI